MKLLYVCFLLCCFAASSSMAKTLNQDEKSHEEKDQLDLIAEDEEKTEDEEAVEDPSENEVDGDSKKDPCEKVRCGTGRVCEVNEQGDGICVCIKECPSEADERRRVCTNHNETWNSDCELYRMRCICDEEKKDCKDTKYKHAHVDYYGGCRDIPQCSEEEMEDFPRRMREWLFNVMQDLAQREELEPPYLELEHEAESNLAKKWVNAVIWKFCDLDSHPFDRSVSRHELFPIRAPLLAMEHCIAPFLNSCDADDDHQITLKEWGHCLGLDDNEIEDKCVDIRSREE